MKQTIYHSMVLTENDIRVMVTECVQHILEVHGAIDDKLEGLARLIISKIRAGEHKFTLTKDDVEKYYPYRNCPDSLDVVVERRSFLSPAAYRPTTKCISISSSFSFFDDDYILEMLMHELTHWVNDIESNGGLTKGQFSKTEDTNIEKDVKNILYLFDSSEMQARVSGFRWALKRGVPKTMYESITHLNFMRSLIKKVEEEQYFDYEQMFGVDDTFGTIIEGLLYQRGYYKYTIDGKERWLNFLNEKEFTAAKNSILNVLKRKYKKFASSISKNLYDFSSK